MTTLKMFVYLCLSGLLVLSGFLQGASADENSGVSVLSLTDETHLGYIGWINTGYNEWDSVISFIDSLGLDNYEYIIRSDSQGDIDILYDFDKWSSNTTAYFKKKGTCVASGNTSYSCSTATQSNYHNFTQAPLFAMNVTQPSYYSDVVNWNAVSFEQAKVYYQNSNANQATTQDVIDTINGQWEMDDNDNLGVDSLVPEVEDKLGVLGFASDTLIQFVDLFNPSNVNSTSLVFPAFSIDVAGESYQVWNDVSYDLNTLYEDFSFLIDTVRTILTLFVWIAVFNYLVKEYERFVNG